MSARPLGRSLAVLAAVISAIAIPAIQMTQNIGLTAAEFSSQGDQTLRVAGYAFSIWGLIYFGLTAYAIYQLTMARETPTLRAVAWPSVVAITGCGAWILASAFNQQALTVAIIVASAAVMVRASVALLQIERIKGLTFANTPAHQLAIKYRIRRGLDEK